MWTPSRNAHRFLFVLQERHIDALAQFFGIEIFVMEFAELCQTVFSTRKATAKNRIFMLRHRKRYHPIFLCHHDRQAALLNHMVSLVLFFVCHVLFLLQWFSVDDQVIVRRVRKAVEQLHSAYAREHRLVAKSEWTVQLAKAWFVSTKDSKTTAKSTE